MRKIAVPFAFALTMALLPVGSAAQAEPQQPAGAGKNKVLKIDPQKDCETVKTTVCRNKGDGMKCEVVDTKKCKMY